MLVITGIDHVQLAMPGGQEDGEIPGIRRFHTHDPFGNRVEFQQA